MAGVRGSPADRLASGDDGMEWDALLPKEDVGDDADLGDVKSSPFDAAIDLIGFGRAQVCVNPDASHPSTHPPAIETGGVPH